ncbi:group II intron-encoded protein LtrA [Bacillus methanolicus MGA3]|nr:group II intron-encoded protein LtrA [Bacillus methanolicus MGA3]
MVMEDGQFRDTELGTPQGGVISPLLANIYLNYMDTIWEKQFSKNERHWKKNIGKLYFVYFPSQN